MATAVGAATVKFTLLLKAGFDSELISAYLRVVKPITFLIMIGLTLLTLSGIGWLLLGYPLAPLLIVKIVFVAMIWLIGPVIDKVLEPKFQRLAPAAGVTASPEFRNIRNQYLAMETFADVLFYAIVIMWVLR
jgi:hypothetical protein